MGHEGLPLEVLETGLGIESVIGASQLTCLKTGDEGLPLAEGLS